MRLVITGAAGFLGSHLSDRFLADGHEVVGVDNFLTGRPVNIAHLAGDPRFTFVEADVSDGLEIAGAVDGVLHFASPASPPDYQAFPVETLRVGSAGTLNALELARVQGARFFMASTSEVYGDPLVHPQPESYWGNVSSTGPRSMYDEAKRFSEAAVMTYRRHHGVDTRIVRIFNTYGPRMRPEDGRVVSNFVVQALRGSPLTVYGDGSQTRSFCYVSDLIEGITRLFHSGHQEPTNVGNPVEFTMLELARQVLEATGSTSEVEYLPLPADDPKVRQPDITLARDVLGWSPTVPLREGLRHTVAWFRQEVGG
ncbi:MAG: UDP-glucuronic acid decarboxylase family protein [Gemmatimonadota bacterium]